MYIVLANTGNWDADQLGVIGTVDRKSSLPDFIKNDLANLADHDSEWIKGVFVPGFTYVSNNPEATEYLLNELEYTCWSNIPAAGHAIFDIEDDAPIMYVLVSTE